MLRTEVSTCLAFVVVLTCFTAPSVRAAGEPFLRGYTRALLDSDFPGLNVSVATVSASNEVTLASDQCLAPGQREQVRSRLTRNSHIRKVYWELPCKTPEAARAKAAARPPKAPITTLPNTKIFRPLLADQRAPRFSGYYQYHENNGAEFNGGAASFGETFGILRSHYHDHPYQLGIEAAVFALFNLDTQSHDLVNADYMVGLPVTYRTGNFSYRARIYHISSHLGDEFLLNNPQVDRVNLSYEAADFLTSWSRWGVRLYGGGGAIVQSETDLDPALVEFGGEYRYPRLFGPAALVAGADYKLSQTQNFGLNESYILGLAFHKSEHTVRTVLQYYAGFSPNGQFFTEQVRFFGFGLQFDL